MMLSVGVSLTGATHVDCKASGGWRATRDLEPVAQGKGRAAGGKR